MHIGLDGFPLVTPRTGVGHYTFELALALARLAPGDRFDLVSPAAFETSVLDEIARAGLENLTALNLHASRIRGHWWGVGLPLHSLRSGFDLFHGTNFELPLWRNRASVVTIHDLSTLLFPETHRPDLVRRSRRRLPLVVKMAARIITPTESVKRELCEHFGVRPEKIRPVPSAARATFNPLARGDAIVIRNRLAIEEDFLLFVGTIEPRKNLLTLLKAFSAVVRETSWRPQLVIAGGEGWLMEETLAFVRGSEIADRFHLTGYLGDEELRALYSLCRMFIYPSLYEGFGLPPLEAISCGAPVIAGRIAALQEVLGSAAHFCDPNSTEALAQSIVDLLDNEELRDRLAKKGAEQAAKYSWERTARMTLDVYHEVLDCAGR